MLRGLCTVDLTSFKLDKFSTGSGVCVCVWFMFTDVVPAHIYIDFVVVICLFARVCVCVCVKIPTGEVAKLNYECLTTHIMQYAHHMHDE